MRLGVETNTRWLWFITYILLPLNVIAQVFGLFWLLDADQGEIGILFILAELGLAIATIIGLHQFRTWGWYCIMVVFGIQLIGTPLKVHAKASLRYEVTQAANSYLQSQGRSPLITSKPSIFDFEPMLTFFLLLAVWTIPNAIYMSRRRHLFGVTEVVVDAYSAKGIGMHSQHKVSVPVNSGQRAVVTEEQETLYVQAATEFDSGNIRQGLWTKITLDETEPGKQRAAYIRERVAQLMYESAILQPKRIRDARRGTLKKWWRETKSSSVGSDIAFAIIFLILWPVTLVLAPLLIIRAFFVYYGAEKA